MNLISFKIEKEKLEKLLEPAKEKAVILMYQ